MSIAENLTRAQERIAAAARRSGRVPDEVRLMAVSKTFPEQAILEAYEAGQRLFGENRVQEFAAKSDRLSRLGGAEFHMIGHLQTNKAAQATELFCAVDSLDSFRLAEKLNGAAAQQGRRLEVLIELNLGQEASKTGLAPDSPDLEKILQEAPQQESLRICGLMTVPPYTEDPEGARPSFRCLRELRDKINRRKLPGVEMNVLSMGMSHDFEIAIQEGSTCVRLGTAIFGARPKPKPGLEPL